MTPSSRITGSLLCDCTHSRGNPGFWEGLESIPANICCLPTDLESLVAIKGKKKTFKKQAGKANQAPKPASFRQHSNPGPKFCRNTKHGHRASQEQLEPPTLTLGSKVELPPSLGQQQEELPGTRGTAGSSIILAGAALGGHLSSHQAGGHGTFRSKGWKEFPDTIPVPFLRSAARLSAHKPSLSEPKVLLAWGSEV